MKNNKWIAATFAALVIISQHGRISSAQGTPKNWSVTQDLTVTYSGQAHNLPYRIQITDEQRKNIRYGINFVNRRAGLQVSDQELDQQVDQEVAREETPPDATPYNFRMTESVRNPEYLFGIGIDGVKPFQPNHLPSLTIFDGKQTVSSLISTSKDMGARVNIDNGFTGRELGPFPIFCSDMDGLQFIKDVVPTGAGRYQAQVFYAQGMSEIEYLPSVIETRPSSNGPEISTVTSYLDGYKRSVMTMSGGTTLGQVNVPQNIHEVMYYASKADYPIWECDYQLKSLSARPLDKSSFSIYGLLNSKTEIEAMVHGKDVIVPGYRSDMSLADQEEQAYIEQEAISSSKQPPRNNYSGLFLLLALVFISSAFYVRLRRKAV